MLQKPQRIRRARTRRTIGIIAGADLKHVGGVELEITGWRRRLGAGE